LKETFIIILWY